MSATTRTAAALHPAAMQLSLLRGFEVRRNGVVVSLPPSSQRLVAFLALHDRSLRRSYVSGTLWLDSSDARANANLRSALWRISGPSGDRLVAASSTHVRLDPEVVVDFHRTYQRARAIVDAADPALVADLSELDDFADDLLPDWYEDWIVVERERFRQVRLRALDRLAEHLVSGARYGDALKVALAAVRTEPLRESAHRQAIRAHLGEGNIGEAVRQYRTYAALLGREIGAKPSPAMEALIAPVGHRVAGARPS